MQVVGNDRKMSGDHVEKWDLMRKNSACSINKFQNKLSAHLIFFLNIPNAFGLH